jgi:hypothetical protein
MPAACVRLAQDAQKLPLSKYAVSLGVLPGWRWRWAQG